MNRIINLPIPNAKEILHGRRDVVPPAVVVASSRALVVVVVGMRGAFVLVLRISLTSSQENEEEGQEKHCSTRILPVQDCLL